MIAYVQCIFHFPSYGHPNQGGNIAYLPAAMYRHMETLAQSSRIVHLQVGDQRAALCIQVARIYVLRQTPRTMNLVI